MAFTDFYRQPRWRELRKYLIQERSKDGLLYCEHCGKPILKDYDAVLHHKIELSPQNVNDNSIAYNPNNLIFVHTRCHNEIHKRFSGQLKAYQRKVYYVFGAPLSGKSSFVKDNAVKGDLIVDIDRIWECISGQPQYIKPNELRINVFQVRDCLLDIVKTRAGKWNRAWVISATGRKTEIERQCNILGAEEIHIDTPKDVCIQRLHEQPDGRDIEMWTGFIDKHFEDLQNG